MSLKRTAILGNQAALPLGGRKAQRDTSPPPPPPPARRMSKVALSPYLGGRGLVQEGSQGWKARRGENWAGIRKRTGSDQASLGQSNQVLGIGLTEQNISKPAMIMSTAEDWTLGSKGEI